MINIREELYNMYNSSCFLIKLISLVKKLGMNNREELYKYYGKEYTDKLFDQEEFLIKKFSSIIKSDISSEDRKIKECAAMCALYAKLSDPVTVD